MRIIAGKYSSRKLETRKGSDTRPTLDKVREAVFSSLGGFFDGGIALDLYAGSGACGLEALSRGMDYVYFSDVSREAVSVIRKNIAALKAENETKVYPVADTKMLDILITNDVKLDLVYIDPPYAKQKNMKILEILDSHDMITEDGAVVIESLKEEEYRREDLEHLRYVKEVEYGIMKITYYRHR